MPPRLPRGGARQPVVPSSWDCQYQDDPRRGGAQWCHGDDGVRAGGAALARPGLARRPPGCRPAGIGARPGCAARSWRCWRGSRSTTSPASNRAGRPTRRSRSSRRWPGRCGCPGPSATHLFHARRARAAGPGTVPAYITPSVQRMLDRLTGTPVAVFDAAWTLLLANPLYAALMGDRPAARQRAKRGVAQLPRLGQPRPPYAGGAARASRPRWSPTCARPPTAIPPTSGCGGWSRSCARTATGSPSCGIPEPSAGTRPSRKTIDHPQVGP